MLGVMMNSFSANLLHVTQQSEPSSLKNESGWMTTEQVAKYLNTSVGQVRNLVSRGLIPYYKLGRLNRYRRSDLDCLIEKQKRGGYQWE